jgi:hypothetical protein
VPATSKPTKSKLPSAADLFNSVDTASFMVGAGGKRKVGSRFHLYMCLAGHLDIRDDTDVLQRGQSEIYTEPFETRAQLYRIIRTRTSIIVNLPLAALWIIHALTKKKLG